MEDNSLILGYYKAIEEAQTPEERHRLTENLVLYLRSDNTKLRKKLNRVVKSLKFIVKELENIREI